MHRHVIRRERLRLAPEGVIRRHVIPAVVVMPVEPDAPVGDTVNDLLDLNPPAHPIDRRIKDLPGQVDPSRLFERLIAGKGRLLLLLPVIGRAAL